MSVATTTSAPRPTLSTSPRSHSFNSSADHPYSHRQPHSPALSPTHMSFSEADSALQQQSKRLAGLSITNATGTKVSILNDNSAELSSSPKQQSSPRSPQQSFGRRERQHSANDHPYAPHHSQRYQSYPDPHHSQQEHRRHYHNHHQAETSYETGRSSSLTNASTPIYSPQELASCKASSSSSSSSKNLTVSSQRSRSLSGGSALSPRISTAVGPALSSSSSVSVSSPTYPFFTRSYSEDNQSDDSESYRRMSDPSSSSTPGPTFVKRKYSCSYPGCNKCFTTSGHLARHNRIHTGERNFSCLMPGCPSKFSRQDNMMQHYRTHISPKSRRGTTKKEGLGSMANSSQETLGHYGREHSPGMAYHGSEYEQQQHHHIAKMNSSRQGSRQNSPPRFNPLDRSGSVEYSHSASGGSLRHKKSGIIQTHQHHTPMPHFNVQAMTLAHQQAQQAEGHPQGTLPSPLTPTIAQAPVYHHQPAYVPPVPYTSTARQQDLYLSHKHVTDVARSPNNRYRSDAVLASPTSPMTQDVERMEGVAPALEHDRSYHHQAHHQSQYQSQYQHQHQHQTNQSSHSTHAGHAQQSHHHHHHNGYQLPPLSLQAQERKTHDRSLGSHLNPAMPPSPQSTPHTPTKYRFDPIQDCLQQDKHQHQQQRDLREQHEQHYDSQSRFASHYQGGAAVAEDEDMSSTTRSSVMSSASSMTSISSASSASVPATSSNHRQRSDRQDSGEELSGLAHLAQIVTTFG